MRYKCHVTQLPFTNFHTDSLCFVFLFYFQGDIATCAGTYLYVWSVNGQLIVKENTSLQNTNHIQCCAMSEVRQTTCNRQRATTLKLSQTISFFFSPRYLWDLKIVPLQLSLVRYDEALLMRLATRFFSTIQEQWRTPNDPPTPWSEG